MGGSCATAQAQNTAVIHQQSSASGTGHEASVVQQGRDNTSVINQGSRGIGNRTVIRQSGSGNVATISQGTGRGDSLSQSGQSVNVTQSGAGDVFIDQTDGSNTIHVHQSDPDAPLGPDGRKRKRANGKRPK